jgi:hypothetical protein
VVRFFFRVAYGAGAEYEAMDCYDWVFTFDWDDPVGTIQYAVPTLRPLSDFGYAPDTEAPEMGFGFMVLGQLDGLTFSGGEFTTDQPTIEPALIKSDARAYVNSVNLANEPRPCPPECCPSSSSSSPESSEQSSEQSSAFCEVEEPPEPALQSAPLRLALPDGRFVGDIRLTSGYNLQISLIESQSSLKFDAVVNGGAGMQCEDLRIHDDGEPVFESCEVCSPWVYGINGHGYPAERMQLVSEAGVLIVPDPDNHRIWVILEDVGICRVDI